MGKTTLKLRADYCLLHLLTKKNKGLTEKQKIVKIQHKINKKVDKKTKKIVNTTCTRDVYTPKGVRVRTYQQKQILGHTGHTNI